MIQKSPNKLSGVDEWNLPSLSIVMDMFLFKYSENLNH